MAVLVTRRPGGEAKVSPVVETVQRDGICHELLVPAPLAPDLAAAAQRLARGVADAVDAVGVMAWEIFLADGRLLINEIAARPHNSGHRSTDSCVPAKFEQHLRAVLDWPLGRPDLVVQVAAIGNALGPPGGADPAVRLPAAIALPGILVHLSGRYPRPGRKLGHATALDRTPDAARRTREAVAILTGVDAEWAAA